MEDHALSDGPIVSGQDAAPSASMVAPTAALTSDDMLDLVLTSLDDDKGEDVVSIPLKGKTEIADHMVVAPAPLRVRWRRWPSI